MKTLRVAQLPPAASAYNMNQAAEPFHHKEKDEGTGNGHLESSNTYQHLPRGSVWIQGMVYGHPLSSIQHPLEDPGINSSYPMTDPMGRWLTFMVIFVG